MIHALPPKRALPALLLALLLALSPAASAHTRQEVRAAYAEAASGQSGSPYAEAPAVAAPYAPGALTEDATAEALGYLNFARWLAGLEPVAESTIYDYQCQHGAVLLAALDYVDHNAPQPADMDRNFYDSAHIATSSGNIARFNWMRDTILREGVEYFLRDDGDGWCALNLEGYGAGPCLIFRPDFTGTGFTDYQQNQRWTVRVDGLARPDGSPAPMEYEVEMISLSVQDVVNVEITPLEASLAPGETLRLTADVIPAYADDLTVSWRSTDESVATVDGNGLATAVGPGECAIVASAGRFEDACSVTVAGE